MFDSLWLTVHQDTLSFTLSQSLLKFMSTESVKLSKHLIFLLLSSIFPNNRVFSNALAVPISWANYWSFSFSITPSNEYSGLISFRIDWFDLLAVQGTLKRLLQHHSWKASILQHPLSPHVLSCSVVSDSLQPGCSQPGFSVHNDSPGKNTGLP